MGCKTVSKHGCNVSSETRYDLVSGLSASTLFGLEMKKIVKRLSGNLFTRNR